jgi:signal transduction histidine kinase
MMALFCAVVGVLLALSFGGFYFLFDRVTREQLDRRLAETAGPVVADLIADPEEKDVDALEIPDEYFEVIDKSGSVVQQSKNLPAPLPLTELKQATGVTFRTLDVPSIGTVRAALVPFAASNCSCFLVVGAPTRELEQTLKMLRGVLLALFPASLLLTAAVSGAFATRSLRPVADLTRNADRMMRELSPHVPGPTSSVAANQSVNKNEDELRLLEATFHKLFDQLDAAIRQIRQFVTDASHELKTPLAVLRGETELLLARPRDQAEYERAVRIIDAELKKLSRIVEGLFTLSMADAGQLRIAEEPLYLEEIVEEACALATPLARNKGIAIESHLQRDVACYGDGAFLRQLFLIFLDNAVKYSRPGSRVVVTIEADTEARIRFEDQGVGIAAEHLPRIFERFYRAAPTASGEAVSGGLGLAIAQAIVRAHRGVIECSSEPGVGSVFTVRLPLRDMNEN